MVYFRLNWQNSIRSAVQEVVISYLVWSKFWKNMKCSTFYLSNTESLSWRQDKTIQFCEQMIIRIQEEPKLIGRLIWTDEIKSYKEEIFNNKNCHYWTPVNYPYTRNAYFSTWFVWLRIIIFLFKFFREIICSFVFISPQKCEYCLNALTANIFQNCRYQMNGAALHSTNTYV